MKGRDELILVFVLLIFECPQQRKPFTERLGRCMMHFQDHIPENPLMGCSKLDPSAFNFREWEGHRTGLGCEEFTVLFLALNYIKSMSFQCQYWNMTIKESAYEYFLVPGEDRLHCDRCK
jgi:hypothetical protein